MTTSSPKVYNKHHNDVPAGAVYIGRGSKWGNHYVIGQDGARAEVIARYKESLLQNKKLLSEVKTELAGKCLICFCAPLACHGDVLLEIANK